MNSESSDTEMRSVANGVEEGGMGAPSLRRRPRRLSQMFAQIARDADGDVSVAGIRDAMGDRGFAALLVFFSALNLIPAPPGTTLVLGLPLVFLGAQMAYGSRRPWLPDFVARRSITAEQFRALMSRVIPRLERLERFIRPRYWPFWRRRGDRVIGFVAVVMGVIVTLPIPLGNWLPAFATALFGLALSERDGILFALASLIGVAAFVVIGSVIGTAGYAFDVLVHWYF
ncbi:MAG TPA: exopolysaccharide biosynthesis protein [Mesorhizobium sp.]|nr:exopolysaccharide biosynthesis protein [Mesorhizobium sp.]